MAKHDPSGWSQRPLPPFVIDYAANDVKYLPQLYEKMFEDATRRGLVAKIKHCSESKQNLDKHRSTVDRTEATEHLRGAASGGAAAPTPTRIPAPAGKTRKDRIQDAVISFAKMMAGTESMQLRCEDKVQFGKEWNSWKATELRNGRSCIGSPSDAINCWFRLPRALVQQHRIQPLLVIPGGVGLVIGGKGSKRARRAATAQRLVDNRGRVEADKGGVRVTFAPFEDVIAFGNTVTHRLHVKNNGSEQCTIQCVGVIQNSANFSLDPAPPANPLTLPSGADWTCSVRARPSYSGMIRGLLSIELKSCKGASFGIGRYLEARCGDLDQLDVIKPTQPYARPKRRRLPKEDANAAIIRAPADGSTPKDQRVGPKLDFYDLKHSDMPRLLREDGADAALMDGNEQMAKLRVGTSDSDALKAYCQHQDNLLYAEEIQLNHDLRMFDFVDEKATVLRKSGALLWLKVPGLAEKRPSVLKGDKVRAKLSGTHGRLYEGMAVEIREEEVGLRFNRGFAESYNNQRIDVHFVLGRRPMRLFHQGIEEARGLRASLIFPEPTDILQASFPARMSMTKVPWNENLNDAQRCAVDAIVKATHRNVPYVIFGPPGTGKTTTLVEAVLQCAKQGNKDANSFKILVCAPTNTAADFIATKLAKVHTKSTQLLRVVAYSRSKRDVPAVLVDNNLTNFNSEEGTFETPSVEAICKPLVVVATLTKAAGFVNDGVPRGHFDMIMIDEAGQAFEQEAVAAAACLLSKGGQLVVAGDPKQLGPVVHHTLANEHGLATSYLERLMTRNIYQKQPAVAGAGAAGAEMQYNENVLTKLVENYRSHATLLQLPNKLFYENDLIAKVNPVQGNSCCHWNDLPKKGFPLMWTGIQGKDEREANSPSWFNGDEALQVVRHVKDLLEMKSSKITPEQIGIISPYNKQVHKIRKLLQYEGIVGVKVGSTEMFQGQERRVIIISTVRSCPDHVSFDKQHNLGFLDNPKRFNVATTRAQALMIVVGNPIVLASDPCWRGLLQLCVNNGAYRGEALPSGLLGDSGEGGDGAGAGAGASAGAGAGAGAGRDGSDAGIDALVTNIEALLLDEIDDSSHQMEEGSMEMPSHE